EFLQGTSMASPAVAGVAAMLRSYYPELTAAQVKQIIMDSGVTTNINVILGGEGNNQRPFSEISKSGKMVNMYNAFLMAEKMTNKQLCIKNKKKRGWCLLHNLSFLSSNLHLSENSCHRQLRFFCVQLGAL